MKYWNCVSITCVGKFAKCIKLNTVSKQHSVRLSSPSGAHRHVISVIGFRVRSLKFKIDSKLADVQAFHGIALWNAPPYRTSEQTILLMMCQSVHGHEMVFNFSNISQFFNTFQNFNSQYSSEIQCQEGMFSSIISVYLTFIL